jgi:short-subunit dehydrogenase
MKRLDYTNKIVVLSGASSGIGKEIARELITKHNCLVLAIARNEERLNATRNELGENYVPFAFDVSNRQGWENLAEFLQKSLLRVDILINCAGALPKFDTIEGTSIEALEGAMAVNYLSQVYACKLLLPYINDLGAIVNISSASALCPFGFTGAYGASKSASMQFSQTLSAELRDIRVSTVLPGFVRTDIMKNQEINSKEAKLIKKFSADCHKTVKRLLRRVSSRKRRIVLGADAHFLSFLYRVFPRTAPRLITWFLRKSGLELFK